SSLAVPFDEAVSLAGRHFEGDWFTLDPAVLDEFDHATYTDQNTHQFADVYPDGLVEGFHLLALLDHLSNPLIRLTGASVGGWNYGFDRIRFVSPVRVTEAIRLVGTVAQVVPRPGGAYRLLLDCAIEIQGRDKPAMVAQWWVHWDITEES
ncbi:hypothetical protein FB565_006058, partial [Actinoplanes lutulentus]